MGRRQVTLHGNCYYATEALFHILGGRRAGWKAMRLRLGEGFDGPVNHWFLKHESGVIVDPSKRQFRSRSHGWKQPDYSKGRGSGFLTKKPSRSARRLMRDLTWQEV